MQVLLYIYMYRDSKKAQCQALNFILSSWFYNFWGFCNFFVHGIVSLKNPPEWKVVSGTWNLFLWQRGLLPPDPTAHEQTDAGGHLICVPRYEYKCARLYDRTSNDWMSNDWTTKDWTTNDWTTKTNATERLTTELLIWTTNIQKIRQFNIIGKICLLNNKNIILQVRLGNRYGSACILR